VRPESLTLPSPIPPLSAAPRAAALAAALALVSLAAAARADFAYSVYQGSWNQIPDFDARTPVATGTTPVLDLSVTTLEDEFGIQFTGAITVPQTGTYLFAISSDDGSDLRIDGATVVSNDGVHGNVVVRGAIVLAAGTHSLRVRYFEQLYGQALEVSYAPYGGALRRIPPDGQLEPAPSPDPRSEGSWGPVIPWPHIAISAAELADGRVLTWSSNEANDFRNNDREESRAALYDPATGAFQTVDNNFHDMFCAGVSTLEDGRIVASGGNPFDTRTSAFDPATLTWQALANMNFNRWYGTNLTLPSNEIWTTFANAGGNTSERYSPASNGWTQTTGATMQDLLNEQNAENGENYLNTAADVQWWGQMAVAPDGRVIHGGPTQTWHLFDPRGSGDVQSLGQPAGPRVRVYGTSVTYAPGRVLLAGGADRTQSPAITNAAYRIDLNGPSPAISAAAPMAIGRALHNSVVLPTGEILAVGGNNSGEVYSDNGSVLLAEIWDPYTDQWRAAASMSVPRNYHSIAVLLKYGRVRSAGGAA